MSKDKKTTPRYRVGDWVTFRYGAMNPVARIVQDRGPIGHKGRRLYQIEWTPPESDPERFELPEENIAPARAPHAFSLPA
jgi:hypothetical protein